MALTGDRRGNIWVGTEDRALWRFSPFAPAGKQWTQFTVKDAPGLDDGIYSLTCDRLGRVWAGTGRSGVAVFTGKAWRTYGPMDGPLGSHVVALTTSPLTGDVWGCTEAGIFQYIIKTNSWHYYTRTDGLPSDAFSCLAFNSKGDLYVGTQSDGIAFASSKGNYRTWRVTRGPDRMPNTPGGVGLPTSLINCLLISHGGTVYAGTTTGLARSSDGGGHWRFLRGADWADIVKGAYPPVLPHSMDTGGRLLAEDYVTSLVEDSTGHLYIGHRQKGLGVYDEMTARGTTPSGTYGGYVDALLAESGGRVLIGTYGNGLTSLVLPAALSLPTVTSKNLIKSFPPLPVPAAPPPLAQMNAMLRVVDAVRPAPHEFDPHAVALDEDWATRGDWLGRYGRYWACLCAICSPMDYTWGAGWEPVRYVSHMGRSPDSDSLRYHVEWLYTSDPRVLEMPPTYLDSRIKKHMTDGSRPRREAEQDDHGENYSMNTGGLGVYETVTVPKGLYVLSLYEMNKDGHDQQRYFRDYRLSVRSHVAPVFGDITGFDKEPEWAHGRVIQFWGGVWKRFLVRGPVVLDVEVGANHSWDTILQAVTLDLVDEEPPPYFKTVDQWEQKNAAEEVRWRLALEQHHSATFRPAQTATEGAGRLLDALDRLQYINSAWWGINGRHFYLALARWYAAQAARPGIEEEPVQWHRQGICEFEAGLYPEWEYCLRRAGLTPARDIEKALRWDGISDVGQDYQVTTEYLEANKGHDTESTSARLH